MLADKVIVSTRPKGSQDLIGDSLSDLGATLLSMPLIEIYPIEIPQNHLSEITTGKYQWLVFTSRNGVNHFFNQYKINPNISKTPFKTAVFGKRTARALASFNISANIINQGNSAVDLYDDLRTVLHPDDKLLLVLGNLAADKLQQRLAPIVSVNRINAYQTDFVNTLDSTILKRIVDNTYDLILFASPSGYRSFKHHAAGHVNMNQLRIACIGPTTEQELVADGVIPLVVADPSGKEGLIKGIRNYFASLAPNEFKMR